MTSSWSTEPLATLYATRRQLGSLLSGCPLRTVAILLGIATTAWQVDLLVPTFEQIPHYDDTAYIRSGHWLVAGWAPQVFAWAPLLSVLHGLVYVVVQESDNWFVLTAAGGRLATYGLFCVGMYECTKSLSNRHAAYAALVVGLTWPIAASFFARWNASDCLFMALSALALSRTLAYLSDRSLRHVVWGSVFVGLAALSRPDGLVLLVSFAVLVFATRARDAGTWRPGGSRRVLTAALVPALLLTGGYIAVYDIATGRSSTGLESRTYQAFEQGHGVIYRERYSGNVMVTGYDDVRALFGTRAANDGSVVRAIARNPGAFAERVAHSVADLPKHIWRAFGGPLAIALLVLALRGALVLWRSRSRWMLVVLLVWHLHMLSYFVTFWRPGYLQFAFVAVALLAGTGVAAVVRNWADPRERTAVTVVLVGLAGWLIWDGGGHMWGDPGARMAPLTVVALLGMALWMPTLSVRCQKRRDANTLALLASLALVSSVATAAGRSPVDRLPPGFGASYEERATATAVQVVPPGTPIVSHGFKLPAASRRPAREMGDLMGSPLSAAAFDRWLDAQDVGAIHLNPLLWREYRPWFDLLVERLLRDPKWTPVFSGANAHTWLFAHRSLLEVEGVWDTHEPALRSEFDVYALEDLLVYVKLLPPWSEGTIGCEDWTAGGKRFFVQIVPVDPEVLTQRQRRKGGTVELSLAFDRNGFQVDGRCVATRSLPGYEIDHITTGQHLPGDQVLWQGRIEGDTVGGAIVADTERP